MGLLDSLTNLTPEQNQGLLAAAAQMLQASGPSRTPTSFGQALGGGLEAYQGSMTAAKKRKQEEEQARQMAEFRAMQMQEMQGGLQDRDAARQQATQMQGLNAEYAQGQSQPLAQPPMPQLGAQPMASMPGQPQPAAPQPQSQQPQGEYQERMRYAQFLRSKGMTQQANAAALEALKFRSEFDQTPRVGNRPDGTPFSYVLDKEGNVKELTGVLPREASRILNLGGKDVAINEYDVKPGQEWERTQTPESIASTASAAASRAQAERHFNSNFGLAKERLGIDRQEAATKAAFGKAPTEFQGKSAAFGLRATEADKILSGLEKEGVTNTGIIKSIAQGTGEMVPFMGDKVGAAIGSGMNALSPYLGGPNSKQQQVEQARRDFVNAVLRQESGAAIGASEFENASKQYFPQPGDSAAVIAQKATNRQLAIQGFQSNAGRAAMTAPAKPAATGGWSIRKVD